jgi:hypothetical protein
MSEDSFLHCPKCKNRVLDKNYDEHVASGHKDHILKEEVVVNTMGGVAPVKPVSVWVQIIDMARDYPRPWLYWSIIVLVGGYLLAWYSIR